jgi:hypothetical protein
VCMVFFHKKRMISLQKIILVIGNWGLHNNRPSFCRDNTRKAAAIADIGQKTHHTNPFSIICNALLITLLVKWVYLLSRITSPNKTPFLLFYFSFALHPKYIDFK